MKKVIDFTELARLLLLRGRIGNVADRNRPLGSTVRIENREKQVRRRGMKNLVLVLMAALLVTPAFAGEFACNWRARHFVHRQKPSPRLPWPGHARSRF